ncbi:MAG: hypothetical protein ACQESE_04865 [Nanobdellota archaeon]
MAHIKKKHKKLAEDVKKYSERSQKVFKHLIQLHEERVSLLGNSTVNEHKFRDRLLKNIHREIIVIRLIKRDMDKEDISAYNLIKELNSHDINKKVKQYFNYLEQCYEVLNSNLSMLAQKWAAYKNIEKRLEKNEDIKFKEILKTVERFHHEEIKMFTRISDSIDYEHILTIEKTFENARQYLKKKPQLHILVGMTAGAIIGLLLSFVSPISAPELIGQTEPLSAIEYGRSAVILSGIGAFAGYLKAIKEMSSREYKLLQQEEHTTPN